jgi:hypothetical protein
LVRKKYFVLGRLEQPRQDKNLQCRHNKPNKPTKKGPLSFLLFKVHINLSSEHPIPHWPLLAVNDLTRDGRLSTYDESLLKLSKVSFRGKIHAQDTH